MKNRVEVKGTNVDGEEVTYYVSRPTPKDLADAQLVAGKVLKAGMKENALMRHQLKEQLSLQGIWTEEDDELLEKIDKEIADDLLKIKKGGIKLSEARDLAINVRLNRMKRLLLSSKKNHMDEFTIESMAENSRFDYLVSVCVKDESGKNVYESMEDYRNRSEEDIAYKCASELAYLLNRLDPNWESNLPENKFLKEKGFIDDKLRLINKEGHYVLPDGRRINEDFQEVDENGKVLNEVDEDGLPKVESLPFIEE